MRCINLTAIHLIPRLLASSRFGVFFNNQLQTANTFPNTVLLALLTAEDSLWKHCKSGGVGWRAGHGAGMSYSCSTRPNRCIYTGNSLSLSKSWGEAGGPGWGELWSVLEVPQNTLSGPSLLRHLLCKERRSKLTWEEHLAKQADMCHSRYKQRHYQISRQSLSPRTIKSPVL